MRPSYTVQQTEKEMNAILALSSVPLSALLSELSALSLRTLNSLSLRTLSSLSLSLSLSGLSLSLGCCTSLTFYCPQVQILVAMKDDQRGNVLPLR